MNKSFKNGIYTYKLSWTRCLKFKCIPIWVKKSKKLQTGILNIYVKAQALNIKNRKKYHVDHIYPIYSNLICGLHVPENLTILTKKANKLKSNIFYSHIIKNGKIIKVFK